MTETNEESKTLDRKDLKILAQKETISNLQEENADLKVELHIAVGQINQMNEILTALQESQTVEAPEDDNEVVDVEKEDD